MDATTALTFSWLNVLDSKRYEALRKKFGSLDEALGHIDQHLLSELGCSEQSQMVALNRLEEFDPNTYTKELEKRSLTLISIEDEAYPTRLKTIADPPLFLYYKGSLEILSEPTIGCVGSREMSSYGKRAVGHFIPSFIRSGVVTVSGLARGIDTEVARETLHAGGKTASVLGHGLAMIYPKANQGLAEEIIAAGGLILSEYPLDTTPAKLTFPARNRIIAGLSLGTVVFEAAKGSGALITADLALEYGRDVFAVPGQIFDSQYAGCHEILSRGVAKLVTEPSDVLQEIGIVCRDEDAAQRTYESTDPEEQTIYEALTTMPQSTSDLVEKAKLDAAIINAKLTMLELHGAAKNVGGGMWVRV